MKRILKNDLMLKVQKCGFDLQNMFSNPVVRPYHYHEWDHGYYSGGGYNGTRREFYKDLEEMVYILNDEISYKNLYFLYEEKKMKYKSINELDTFVLHDAEIEKFEFNNNNMKWAIKNANVKTNNSQNNEKVDMCVENTIFYFQGITIKNIIYLGFEIKDSEGKLISKVEDVEIKEEYYKKEIKKFLNSYCRILGHSYVKENDSYIFTLDSKLGICDIYMKFENIIVEWEIYKGKSFYIRNIE